MRRLLGRLRRAGDRGGAGVGQRDEARRNVSTEERGGGGVRAGRGALSQKAQIHPSTR
jgi:hypothetical protein